MRQKVFNKKIFVYNYNFLIIYVFTYFIYNTCLPLKLHISIQKHIIYLHILFVIHTVHGFQYVRICCRSSTQESIPFAERLESWLCMQYIPKRFQTTNIGLLGNSQGFKGGQIPLLHIY